jgi:hypothetical protein
MFDRRHSGTAMDHPASRLAGGRVTRRSASAMSTIVLLSDAQPTLHRLARERDGLTVDRVIRIRQRVLSGFYDAPEVGEAIARGVPERAMR